MYPFHRNIVLMAFLFLAPSFGYSQNNQSKCNSKFERAHKLYDKREYVEAKELILEIKSECPELSGRCDLLYAHLNFGLSDYVTSADYYTKYIATLKNQPGTFDLYDKMLINRGNAFYFNNSINEAIQDYEQCIQDIGCYVEDDLVSLDIEYLPALFKLSELYEKKYYETSKAIYLYKAVKIGADLYYMTKNDYKCDYCKFGQTWVTEIRNRLFNELFEDDNNKTLAKREYIKFSSGFQSYWTNYLKDSLILDEKDYYVTEYKSGDELVILGNNLTYGEIRKQLERILKYSKYSDYTILVNSALGDWAEDHLHRISTDCQTETLEVSENEVSMEKRIKKFLEKGKRGYWVKLLTHGATISVWFKFENCQFARDLGEKIYSGEAGFNRSKSKYLDLAFECECPDYEKIRMVENCFEEMTIFKKIGGLDSLFTKWGIKSMNEAKDKACYVKGSFLIEELESYNVLSRFIEERLEEMAKPQEVASQSETSRFEWIENNSGASLLISEGAYYGGNIYITDNGDAVFGSDVCKDSYSATFISQSGSKVNKNDPFNDTIEFQSNDLPAILEISYQEGCSGSYRHLKLLIKTVQEFTISF